MLIREQQNQKYRGVRGGFTLLEMLVVVAIIIVLAGVGGYMLLPKLDEAKEDADLIQVKMLTEACSSYKIDKEEWPGSLNDLTVPKANGSLYVENASYLTSKSKPGVQFSYDVSGQHNNGQKPDIWIDTNHGSQIGNWMAKVQR